MEPNTQELNRSRLGRLLVNRGYISEQQLQVALEQQRATGERLGEVAIAAGWITQRELDRTLKHQKRYRYAAAFAAMAVAPLQPITALAATVPGAPIATPPTATQHARNNNGMKALSESEMQSVAGQQGSSGFVATARDAAVDPAELRDLPEQELESASEDLSLDTLELTARMFIPVLNFLDSELSVTGVHFAEDGIQTGFTEEGGFRFGLPERIERIEMRNIRVVGASQESSMGSVTMTDIEFSSDSRITIRPR